MLLEYVVEVGCPQWVSSITKTSVTYAWPEGIKNKQPKLFEKWCAWFYSDDVPKNGILTLGSQKITIWMLHTITKRLELCINIEISEVDYIIRGYLLLESLDLP